MDGIFLHVLGMSAAAAFCIVAVLVIRLLLKRAPKIFSYLLWTVVLVRLICPFFPETGFGVIPGMSTERMDRQTASMEEAVSSGSVQEGTLYGLPGGNALNTAEGAKGSSSETAQNAAETNVSEPTGDGGNQGSIWNAESRKLYQKWLHIGSLVWLAGIGVLLCYVIVSYGKLYRKLRTARILSKGVYESEQIDMPFLLGMIEPKIYLPLHVSEQERFYIMQHERVHLKRLDYVVKPIAFLAAVLHWFNPLVWLAYALMCKDMEMSCDESVIRSLGINAKKEYSTVLLNLSVEQPGFLAGPLAFGENDTKARIRNILSYKKAVFGVICGGVLILVLTAGILLTNRKPEQSSLTGDTVASDGSGETTGKVQVSEETQKKVLDMLQRKEEIRKEQEEQLQDLKEQLKAEAAELQQQAEEEILVLREFRREEKLDFKRLEELVTLNNPTLQDYAGYEGIQWQPVGESAQQGSLSDYLSYELTDEENGEIYRLDVYYWIEDNRLFSINLNRISDGGAWLLYDSDPRYRTTKDIAEIRASKEDSEDWLSFELPEGDFAWDNYRADIGFYGGRLFQYTGEERYTTNGSDWTAPEWKAAGGVMRVETAEQTRFQDGKLIGMFLGYNHSSYVTNAVFLEGCEEQAVIFEMNHDLFTAAESGEAEEAGHPIPEEEQTVSMWYVGFAREGSPCAYYIFLSERYFTREDAVKVAQSVTFTEEAWKE